MALTGGSATAQKRRPLETDHPADPPRNIYTGADRIRLLPGPGGAILDASRVSRIAAFIAGVRRA